MLGSAEVFCRAARVLVVVIALALNMKPARILAAVTMEACPLPENNLMANPKSPDEIHRVMLILLNDLLGILSAAETEIVVAEDVNSLITDT